MGYWSHNSPVIVHSLAAMKSCSIAQQLSDRAVFDYSKHYFLDRNKVFNVETPVRKYSVWERLPPDFRLQSFQPRPVKRSEYLRARIKKIKEDLVDNPDEGRPMLPSVEGFVTCNINSDDFVTNVKSMRPFSAKIDFCKNGVYSKGPYQSPKRFDFRGVNLFYSLINR